MKKIIAVAALVAAGFAAPALPVQAASAYPTKCLVLPLLQADCREMISQDVSTAVGATTAVASATVADVKRPKVPGAAWWTCDKAPEGSKAILTCDY